MSSRQSPWILDLNASGTGWSAEIRSIRHARGSGSQELSGPPGRIENMNVLPIAALVIGVLLGLALGAVVGVVVVRSRGDAKDAEADSFQAAARSDVAQARTEAATARTEVARAQTELARTGEQVAAAGAVAAEARTEAALAQAEAAEVGAQLAAAIAQRDSAVQRVAEMAADRETMVNQFKVLAAETAERQGKSVDASAEARLKATEQLMAPVRASLEAFNLRLADVEKERVAVATDLRNQVRAVQLTGEQLRREANALTTALRKPQIRGSWGETQLKRVAELAGMLERCDFDLQRTMTADDTTMRPDMRVNLAEGKHIFVDSKVPLSAFLDAAEAADERVQTEALARYAKNVRTHVDQLSAKRYWKAADSPEFVVLFLPSEAFFAAALDQIPDLYEYSARRDIVLATPTTLIGLLRAVAYGWKQTALAESATEVFRLGRELYGRLGLMGNRFDKLGRALRTSVNAYNETIATVEGTVLVGARRFRDLKVSDSELGGLTSVDEPIRQIQAPELVEDAVRIEPLVGRESRRAGSHLEMPEAAELVRSDPDLLELVSDAEAPAARERRTS
jgi:DNA recombination protein RmuC